MVVLDDIHHAIHYRLLPLADVVAAIRRRPPQVHLVLTGRNAPLQVLEAADQVTEMLDVKHHFRDGVLAQPGIEY
jgi:cob(I)alamin adenosyltransferase